MFCVYTCVFVRFDSLRPSQHFFSYVARVFLGWTSTKQGIKYLAQEHNVVPPARLFIHVFVQL